MIDGGYIYLWRKIVESSFYKNPNCAHLAIYLLMQAKWKLGDESFLVGGKEQVIKRGQAWVGRYKLSEDTGLSPRSVRTCLHTLSNIGFLTSTPTNKGTLITICKYNDYQNGETKPTSILTSNRPATDQQPTSNRPHLNQDKKDNQDNNQEKIAVKDKPSQPTRIKIADKDWIESLRPDCIKQGIDLNVEIIKAQRWITNTSGRKFTQKFFIGWLNRADKIIQGVQPNGTNTDQRRRDKASKEYDEHLEAPIL